jgi:hypothetical protein
MDSTRTGIERALPIIAVMSGFITALGKDVRESPRPPLSAQEVGVAGLQQSGNDAKKDAGPLTSAERQFLQIAAELDIEGIELANLAAKQGSSVATINLCESLREDHARSFAALRELARSKLVRLADNSTSDRPGPMFELASPLDEDLTKITVPQF